MLKINIVCVGNLKDKFFIDASEEYIKRLSRFCTLKIIELKECNNLSNIEEIKKQEGDLILKSIKGYVFLCDIKGDQIDSEMLSKKINKISLSSSEISFIIGGSYGVSNDVKNSANEIISMSKMTFPHRLFRVMLLEQIYRSFTIINNVGYHK